MHYHTKRGGNGFDLGILNRKKDVLGYGYQYGKSKQMGREVLEGLRASQSQQRPLSRKINKRITAHPVTNVKPNYFSGINLAKVFRQMYDPATPAVVHDAITKSLLTELFRSKVFDFRRKMRLGLKVLRS